MKAPNLSDLDLSNAILLVYSWKPYAKLLSVDVVDVDDLRCASTK